MINQSAKDTIGVYVEIDRRLKGSVEEYRKREDKTLRWCIEKGLERIVSDGTEEEVKLVLPGGKTYRVPIMLAKIYEELMDTNHKRKGGTA